MQTPEQPSRNPIYPWLRMLLWILPAGFPILSAMGFRFFLHHSVWAPSGPFFGIWILLNLLFVIGTGWCDYRLSPRARTHPDSAVKAIVVFFLCQLFLIPFLLACAIFAICAWNTGSLKLI